MKKSIMLCLVSLCASLLYAQSSNAKFIDSPSWVLQGEERVAPVSAPAQVPAQATSEAAAAKSVPSSKSSTASKSAPAPVVKGPKQEGFLHIGVYVMPAINWVGNVSDGYKRDGVTGMVTPTVMVDMRIIRRLFGGVGISFNTLGGRLEAQGTEGGMGEHTSSYNFSYIEIPFRLKLKTPNFGESKGSLFLSAGVSVGFGVNYKYKDVYENKLISDYGQDAVTVQVSGKMKKDAKLANFSIIGQVGYNYQIVKHFNLIVGVEYRYACIDPIKDNRKFNLKDLAFHNHQIGLLLGIMF